MRACRAFESGLGMTDEIFADRMTEMVQVGSTVRIDLETISPHERDPSGGPRFQSRHRVILPLEGFLQTYAAMETMVNRLLEAGVLAKRPGGAAERPVGAPPHAEIATTGDPLPKSPNFDS